MLAVERQIMSLSNDVDVVDEGDKCDVHSTQQFGLDDVLVHGRKAQKENIFFMQIICTEKKSSSVQTHRSLTRFYSYTVLYGKALNTSAYSFNVLALLPVMSL